MLARISVGIGLLASCCTVTFAQDTGLPPNPPALSNGLPPALPARASISEGGGGSVKLGAVGGSSTLPREANQIWAEYPISAYTTRVKDVKNPEQAIVDWILRETGTDAWFTGPASLLNADKDTLRVYHTPEVQRVVADIVERFVNSRAESHMLHLRLCTIKNPNWRAVAFRLMRPVAVQAPGVDAWLLSKENAALLLSQLAKRTDYRDHSSPNLIIYNGQAHAIVRMRPRNYVRSVAFREGAWPSHELEMGQIQEGYTLQFSPLMSIDERSIDAVIKCNIDQIEKFVPVNVDVPLVPGQNQRVQIQVPQIVSWRLHERFRWPTAEVLLLACGVVATPSEDNRSTLGLPNIPNILPSGPSRADALLFIEAGGKANESLLSTPTTAGRPVGNYRGRY